MDAPICPEEMSARCFQVSLRSKKTFRLKRSYIPDTTTAAFRFEKIINRPNVEFGNAML